MELEPEIETMAREIETMAREIETMAHSGNSGMGEKGGLRQGLLPQLVGSEVKTFCLPKPLDDDESDISLKDWQLGLRSSEPAAAYPLKPSKGRTRARFRPVQPWLDEFIISSPDKLETAPMTSRTPRTSRTQRNSVSPVRLDNFCPGDSTLEELEPSNGDGHTDVDVASHRASPGISFNEGNANDAELDNFDNFAGAERVTSLRVSVLDDLEALQSPSPPRVGSTSLSMPKTRAEPTFTSKTLLTEHGREGKDFALPLPEIETAYQSHGMSASRDKGLQVRLSGWQARRSRLDVIGEGTKHDSESNYISSSSTSSYRSQRENTSNSGPSSPSALLRCNGRRQRDEDDKENDKDVKVGIFCGGGSSDTNISADLVQLVSKLCRLSVPLSKQSAPKSSQQRRYHGSDSIPALVSWDSMQSNSGMPYQDFPIIGRQNSLKLLAERCSNGPTPVYEMPKPRKIRDPEPYQHFYKPISKTLDQKLRS